LSYRQSGTGYAVGLPAAGKHLYHSAKKQIMLNLIALAPAHSRILRIFMSVKFTNTNLIQQDMKNKVEEALSSSITFLSNIINKIKDPIFVKDDQSRLLIVNDEFCQLFDLDRVDIIGKTLAENVAKEEQEHFLNVDKQVLADGQDNISEEFLTINDGPTLTISTRKSRYRDENGNKFLIGLIIDITERKKAELDLITAKEKAEESDRLKLAFLANMSHEIRTPLNAILGFSQLMKIKKFTDEQKDKYVDHIIQSGEQLLVLISDIIDVSMIDANQITINASACDINELIDDLHSQFSISSVNKEVVLQTKKGLSNNESVIETDSNRLIQILSNLLENARKFTTEGIIEFGYSLSNDTLRFYVKDTGPGIDPKEHKLIFGRFSQADQEHTFVSGTGLGLSIVKGLVKLLGGKIWIESEIGKGAIFYFTIPYQSVKEKETEASRQDVSTIDRKSDITILIAEDNAVNFLYFEEVFSNYGYTILHAWDGVEALELLKKHTNIDLILMDMEMPVMNGYEATRAIRKTDKSIPIIAQTANAMNNDKQKALEVGCNDYISKPIALENLLEVVNKYINQK